MDHDFKPFTQEPRPQFDSAFEIEPVVLTTTEESETEVCLPEILIRCNLQGDHYHCHHYEVKGDVQERVSPA